MIKAILYERTVAVCASMDFGKGLGRYEHWGDSRWSRWRKETVKTGIRIQNISKKIKKNLLYEKPTYKTYVRTTFVRRIEIWTQQHRWIFRGLGYAQYEWRAFGQPLGSRSVLLLGHSATLVHNTQVLVLCLM